MWNWQQPDWPNFSFNAAAIQQQEAEFQRNAGRLLGAYKHLSDSDKHQLTIALMRDEAITTSEIEGEWLNRDSVQSSLQKQFGLATDNSTKAASPGEEGIAKVMVDLYQNFAAPLTEISLLQWHSDLMAGDSNLTVIGGYRTHTEAIQVVSGPIEKRTVHFEGPPSKAVPAHMQNFIRWFNSTSADSQQPLGGISRAALAHLHFVSIHPFEDGNGRISRTLSEKALAQSIGQPSLTSLSTVILEKRKTYYDALASNNRSLGVQEWIEYFAETVLAGQKHSEQLIDFLIAKTQFFDRYRKRLNPRQEKVIKKMFDAGIDGFAGGLSAQNYIAISKTSRPTATRDLADLVAMGALNRTGELKHTRYWLNHRAL